MCASLSTPCKGLSTVFTNDLPSAQESWSHSLKWKLAALLVCFFVCPHVNRTCQNDLNPQACPGASTSRCNTHDALTYSLQKMRFTSASLSSCSAGLAHMLQSASSIPLCHPTSASILLAEKTSIPSNSRSIWCRLLDPQDDLAKSMLQRRVFSTRRMVSGCCRRSCCWRSHCHNRRFKNCWRR